MFRHRFPLVTTEELGIFLVQHRRKIQKIFSQNPNGGCHIFPTVDGSSDQQTPASSDASLLQSLFKQFEDPRLLFAELSNILGKIKPFRFCRVMHWPFRCL